MEGAERYTSGILPASHTKRGGQDPTKAINHEGNPPGVSPESGPRSQPDKKTPEARITQGTGINKDKTHPRQQASISNYPETKGEEASKQHTREKAGEERFRCEDNSTKAESTARQSTSREVAQNGKRHPQKTEGNGRNSHPP